MLPIPKEFNSENNDVVVKPFDYKIAEIFDSLGNLYQYFNSSGLILKS